LSNNQHRFELLPIASQQAQQQTQQQQIVQQNKSQIFVRTFRFYYYTGVARKIGSNFKLKFR
jgi:hypothetical protein